MNRKFILIILCCLLLSCSETQPTEQNIIIVKVPPFYNEKLSQVENYWHFQRFLFPQQEIPNPLPKDLPHDHSLLFVSIDETGKLTLNSEDEGNVSDTNFLIARLSEIFREREKAGVYEPGKWKIVKAVGVRAEHSIKYGDFIRVVEAVKQSGADPIVLLIDEAKPKAETNSGTKNKWQQNKKQKA